MQRTHQSQSMDLERYASACYQNETSCSRQNFTGCDPFLSSDESDNLGQGSCQTYMWYSYPDIENALSQPKQQYANPLCLTRNPSNQYTRRIARTSENENYVLSTEQGTQHCQPRWVGLTSTAVNQHHNIYPSPPCDGHVCHNCHSPQRPPRSDDAAKRLTPHLMRTLRPGNSPCGSKPLSIFDQVDGLYQDSSELCHISPILGLHTPDSSLSTVDCAGNGFLSNDGHRPDLYPQQQTDCEAISNESEPANEWSISNSANNDFKFPSEGLYEYGDPLSSQANLSTVDQECSSLGFDLTNLFDLEGGSLSADACQSSSVPQCAYSYTERPFEESSWLVPSDQSEYPPIEETQSTATRSPMISPTIETFSPYPDRSHGKGSRRRKEDRLLVEAKRAGMAYKEIKAKYGFSEAESTLRGRFRTLTKDKQNRVRKPEWHDLDVQLLIQGVQKFSHTKNADASSPGRRNDSRSIKIPWKEVARYIYENGGSYHYGNATCKKKWVEIQDTPNGNASDGIAM